MHEFNIDEILTETSWRLKSGIVDFNTDESINTLQKVLKEYEYNSDFIDAFIFNIKNINFIAENNTNNI
jgi:hypothetical protein